MSPEIWDAIVQAFLAFKQEHIKAGTFHLIANDLAKAGYKDEFFWKELKDTVIYYKNIFDAQTLIDLRNTHVEYFPEKLALISFLE